MAPTCHSLSLSSPCSPCAARRSNGADAPEASPLRVAVVEADPVFPASVVAKSSMTPSELTTCLTLLCDSSSSSPPPSVRHERLVKQLALAGPIRKLFSMDPKSTSPEARLPS